MPLTPVAQAPQKSLKLPRGSEKDLDVQKIPAILHSLHIAQANPKLRETAFLDLSEIIYKGGQKARMSIVQCKGIESVVSCMWENIDSSAVHLAACQFLLALCASPDAIASNDVMTNQEEVVNTLLISMQTHETVEEIQLTACAIFGCLATASCNNSKVADGSLSGAQQMVVSALRNHSQSIAVTKAALHTLYCQCALSSNADTNKENLLDSIHEIGAAMQRVKGDPIGLESALRVVWCITSSESLCRKLVTRQADIIQRTIHIAQESVSDPCASSILEACCGIMANVSYLDGSREDLVAAGITPFILDTMRSHPTHVGVQTEACAAIANLSTAPHIREEVRESQGAESVLKAFLDFVEDEDLAQEALRALLTLSIHNPGTKSLLVSQGILPGLLRASEVHARAPVILEYCCNVLATLSIGDGPSEKDLLDVDSTTIIINALNYGKSDRVDEAAVLALRNVASLAEVSDPLMKGKVVSLLVQTMAKYERNTSLLINGCCILWNFAFKTNHQPGTIVDGDGIRTIVKAMQDHMESGELQEAACAALWNLVDDSVQRKKDVVGSGAIDAVGCALMMHPGRSTTLVNACGVLSNVSNEGLLAEAIAHAQGTGMVVEVMCNNTTATPLLTIGSNVLRNIILQFPEYTQEASAVVSTVLGAMKEHPEDRAFQEEACTLLWAMAAQNEDVQSKIFGLGGPQVLMDAMDRNTNDSTIHEAALSAYRQLVSESGNAN